MDFLMPHMENNDEDDAEVFRVYIYLYICMYIFFYVDIYIDKCRYIDMAHQHYAFPHAPHGEQR